MPYLTPILSFYSMIIGKIKTRCHNFVSKVVCGYFFLCRRTFNRITNGLDCDKRILVKGSLYKSKKEGSFLKSTIVLSDPLAWKKLTTPAQLRPNIRQKQKGHGDKEVGNLKTNKTSVTWKQREKRGTENEWWCIIQWA